MDAVVHSSIWWRWWGTHCGTVKLFEGQVPKSKSIDCHDKAEAFSDSVFRVGSIGFMFVLCNMISNEIQRCMDTASAVQRHAFGGRLSLSSCSFNSRLFLKYNIVF